MSFLDSTGDHSADIYFGNGSMGGMRTSLQSWAPGAEPMLVPPDDPGISLRRSRMTDGGEGETIAGKDNSRVLSPAQQLGLEGKPRAHAEKCLADAVYFEARGEVKKGQEAVAQVVMNRVFSGYYPHDVCGVVYQNAGRHLACQFTFACEGKDLDRIDEPDMWEQAKQIAKNMLDGKIWLAEVGHATHYHAYWVHPSWVHEMARLYHLGVHTFYRPLNWGNGDDEPVWGKGPAGGRCAARSRSLERKSRTRAEKSGSGERLAGRNLPRRRPMPRAHRPRSSSALDFDIQSDVEILHRVGERARRQIIHAGLRDRRRGIERDAAGRFDDKAAGNHGNGLAHGVEIEIVDEDDVGQSDIEHFLELIE